MQASESRSRFCSFIDGLDEFDGDHRDLIDAISLLIKSPAIKVCVSSRPWQMFQQAYGYNENLHLTPHSLRRRDIGIYVETSLETSSPGTLGQRELRQLGNAVRDRAEDVLLWVTLAVRNLRRGIGEYDSLRMLQDRLEAYPTALQDFFKHIFAKIDPAYRRFTGRRLLTM